MSFQGTPSFPSLTLYSVILLTIAAAMDLLPLGHGRFTLDEITRSALGEV